MKQAAFSTLKELNFCVASNHQKVHVVKLLIISRNYTKGARSFTEFFLIVNLRTFFPELCVAFRIYPHKTT